MEEISTIWCYLLSKSDYSFFLSWAWMKSWLNSLSREKIFIELFVVYDAEEPVSCFFIKKNQDRRWFFRSSDSYYVNTTGKVFLDEISIEYNSILINDLRYLDYICRVFKIKITDWDKFFLQGFKYDLNLSPKLGLTGFEVKQHSRPSYYIDLTKIKESNYLGLLSANTRYQIRRSIKEYEKISPIKVRCAETLDEALVCFSELKKLHQEIWLTRGKKGSFSNHFLNSFHTQLIMENFHSGNIQFFQVYNALETIGVLYNFVDRGVVYCYQSGFNYKNDNLYRPGLVSHYYSIIHNCKNGNVVYDFLVGDDRYKKSMSTDSNQLYWIKIQKKNIHLYLENKVKGLFSALRA